MNSAYLYLQLYRLFDEITPVNFDCGKFCKKACCKGKDSGMLLFPGESAVFSLLTPEWARIEKSSLTYDFNNKTYHVPLLICDGTCDRYQRPLACRIFPLTPYISKEGVLTVKNDPRAKSICPLPLEFSVVDYDKVFADNIRKTFKLLQCNPRLNAFLQAYSRYLDEFDKFYR